MKSGIGIDDQSFVDKIVLPDEDEKLNQTLTEENPEITLEEAIDDDVTTGMVKNTCDKR